MPGPHHRECVLLNYLEGKNSYFLSLKPRMTYLHEFNLTDKHNLTHSTHLPFSSIDHNIWIILWEINVNNKPKNQILTLSIVEKTSSSKKFQIHVACIVVSDLQRQTYMRTQHLAGLSS